MRKYLALLQKNIIADEHLEDEVVSTETKNDEGESSEHG